MQDYQSQHYESVLKVIDVLPPGIVLPVTDIKSNKFKEAINDRALGVRAKTKNKKDLLAYCVPYRLRGTLSSVYLLFLQAGIKVVLASFPGAWSPVSLHLLCCADIWEGARAGEPRVLVGGRTGACCEGQHVPVRLVKAVPLIQTPARNYR